MLNIRPFNADYAAVAELLTADSAEPITAAELERRHSRFPADGLRNRLVAQDEAGRIIGYATAQWAPGQTAGLFGLRVVVDSPARRQGVGATLLSAEEAWVEANGGTAAEVMVRDDDDPSVQFARNRGYRINSHEWVSTLDLAAFDASPFGDLLQALAQGGIRFFTYADEPGEESRRKLRELYAATTDGPTGYWSPEFWENHLFSDPNLLPEGIILAAQGDRFVGCTTLVRVPGSADLLTDYTGVRPEFRGQKLGLALKLISVDVARRLGAPAMRTRNDANNLPMLAINRKMGYQKVRGEYWLIKSFEAGAALKRHQEVYATPDLPAFEYSQLDTRLFAGRNPLTAVDVEQLVALGITHLLDLREAWEWTAPRFGAEALDAIEAKGLARYHLPIPDLGAPRPIDLDRARAWLTDVLANPAHRVYVHCRAGLNRTAAVLVAYYAQRHNLTYQVALESLRAKRPLLTPLKEQERAVQAWLNSDWESS